MAHRSLAGLVGALAESADRPAIIARDRRGRVVWPYAELADRARRLADGLSREEEDREGPIALLAANSAEWVAAFLGIAAAGRIALPLDVRMPDAEIGRILHDSGSRRIFTTADRLDGLRSLEGIPDLEVLLFDAEGIVHARPWQSRFGDGSADLPEPSPDATAALLYTSGTTGAPKGVPLTHGNLMHNVASLVEAGLATPDDRLCLPLPMHHAYPLTVGVLAPLTVGATIVLPAGLAGRAIQEALADEHCTILLGVPRLYEALLAGLEARLAHEGGILGAGLDRLIDFLAATGAAARPIGHAVLGPIRRRLGPDLRILASGGAALAPSVARRLEALGFRVLTGYGLTETSPILTFNRPGAARLDTVGQPVPHVELRIATNDESTEHGEIQARGPNVFRGYWHNPEASEAAFTADGWFRTGDLGWLDKDNFLHIAGRAKEVLVLPGGKKVFPEPIEQVFLAAPEIADAALLESNERLVLLVVPDPEELGAVPRGEVDEKVRAVVRTRAQQVADYARPSRIVVTRRALPRTLIGKLKRHELEEILRAEESGRRQTSKPSAARLPGDEILLAEEPSGSILRWLETRHPDAPLSLDTDLRLELGLDSFDWMNLTLELEERFGIHVSDEQIGELHSLRDLLTFVREARPEDAAERMLGGGIDERWLQPQSEARRAVARNLHRANRALMRQVFDLEFVGIEHLPTSGGYILAPNHRSYLDPLALAAALPWSVAQRVYWAGSADVVFRGPLTRQFSRMAQVFPVERETGPASTFAYAKRVLERGDILVWFPEAQRTRSATPGPFLSGIGLLLLRFDVPAVPVYIAGTAEAWPPERTMPRPGHVRVVLGQPAHAAALRDLGEDPGAPDEDRIASGLRQAVLRLAREPTLPPLAGA